ncbi:MAG: transporter [Armatimonadota bacterium]
MKTPGLIGRNRVAVMAVLLTVLLGTNAWAIGTIGARAYLNAPVDTEVIFVQYQPSHAGFSFDGDPPLPAGSKDVSSGVLNITYRRWLDVAGREAFVIVGLPFSKISAELSGTQVEASESGLGDPTVRFGCNISGAPALKLSEFRKYKQDLIFSGSLAISVPLGAYSEDRQLNTGSNRWIFLPELALSKAQGEWVYELYAHTEFYTDNSDYFGGARLQQDPLFGVETHISRNLLYARKTPLLWASFDAYYANGGQQSIDGTESGSAQDDLALGFTIDVTASERDAFMIRYEKDVSVAAGRAEVGTWTFRYYRFGF